MRSTKYHIALLSLLPAIAVAQSPQQYLIDARDPAPAIQTGHLKLGANTAPSGSTISTTNRYLLRDGKPWLPVMGEFHYSRYPQDQWEEELLKLKAGGVQIVASYVIWIHHEEEKGKFDWSGQRDLRRFVELAAKHGLYAYPRIGPWSHAEVRNGGFPNWLVAEAGAALRSDDSAYLGYVDRFYREIFKQLDGLLWKQRGPIIGIQLENEYNQRGEKRGEQHILTLKRLARAAGFDVPLYTVTGWDNTVVPEAEVIPVFGGYPDMPWDASIEELPPGEVYAFRFDNRWAGNRAALGPDGQLDPTAQAALAQYPFLGAEYGGGIQITYHRRPVISADDIAAMLPVQIGSGVNLYGYYMFHGGTNPRGKLTTLQESQRTGYPTDVPVYSYDFQTLLGEFGEVRQSYRKVKLMHYFLNEFGEQLAPMVLRRPARTPASSADTTVLRFSARTLDNRGFLFVNNYIRNYPMPAHRQVQFTVQLPNETLRVPEGPVDVPANAYFVWPINLEMNGALLKYSTAQLVTRYADADGVAHYFFVEVPGITPEFAFDAATLRDITAPGGRIAQGMTTRAYVRSVRAGTAPAVVLTAANGARVRIVVLTQQQAEHAWRLNFAGADRLVLTDGEVFSDGARLHVRAQGQPVVDLAVFPALPNASLRATGSDSVFTRYTTSLPARTVTARAEKVRAAAVIPPVKRFNAVTWRKVEIALAPSDSAFDAAAVYRIAVPAHALDQLHDVILEVNYVGDIARLYAGDVLLNDNFFNGTPWRISLRRYADALRAGPLELRILPLRRDAPIYLAASHRPRSFPANGQIAAVTSVQAIPVYELIVQ